MRSSILSLAFLLFFVLLAGPASGEDAEIPLAPSISPVELQARREAGTAPVVIDVRSAEEFKAGHIPGALHIPFAEVATRISEVAAPEGVALYCMVGPRARLGEQALLESGYTKVLHIEGGMQAWEASGLPIDE
jgi:rhodanese-related sulfurtransferase